MKIEEYNTIDELRMLYRATKDPSELRHVQIILFLRMEKSIEEVQDLTGFSASWIREIVSRYHIGGFNLLGDWRRHNPGQPKRLTEEDEFLIKKSLKSDLLMEVSGQEQKPISLSKDSSQR